MQPAHIFLLVVLLMFQNRGAAETNATPGLDASSFIVQRMTLLQKAVADASTICKTATNDPGHQLRLNYSHLLETNVPQILDLAQKFPASDASFEALSWIVREGGYIQGPVWTNRLQSLALLARYQATNAKAGQLCGFIGHDWAWRWREKPVTDFLAAVAKDNPDRAARGQAIFSLGRLCAAKAGSLAEFEQWGKTSFYSASIAKFETTDLTRWGDAKSAATAAERYLMEVVTNYADCRDLRSLDRLERPGLKTEAEDVLFELQHLSLGQAAMDIAGEDLNGQQLKLSDRRGRITVLSFWASWCHPCMQLVPVERALAERLEGQPFALIGVNGDGSLSEARRAAERERMTWPSFWNGTNGAEGPISSAWKVSGWPTVYVIDARGMIRFKFEGYGAPTSNMLNGSVDELLKELNSHGGDGLKSIHQ